MIFYPALKHWAIEIALKHWAIEIALKHWAIEILSIAVIFVIRVINL